MQSSQPKQAYDLRKLFQALKGNSEFGDFCNLIKRCEGLQSIHRDLDRAHQSLLILADIDGQRSDPSLDQDDHLALGLQGQALFTLALILYTRCTSKTSEHRYLAPRKRAFTTEQLRLNEEFAKLRDGIAHYSPAEHGGEPWVEDMPLLIFEGDIVSVGFRFKRVDYLGKSANDLFNLISALLDHVENIKEEAERDLGSASQALRHSSPAFAIALKEAEVKPPQGSRMWLEWKPAVTTSGADRVASAYPWDDGDANGG